MRQGLRWLLVCAVLCCPVTAAELRTATAAVVTAPLVVDGKLTEPCWQRAPDCAGFRLLDTGEPATEQTDAWIVRDDTWLYAAFRCHDSAAGKITCLKTERDASVHLDESVEIFVSPGTSGRTYYHFIVTAAGVQGDNRSVGEDHNIDWDGHWRSAATIDTDGKCWYAETAIPLFYLSMEEGEGEWNFNLARERWQAKQEWSCWSPTTVSFHRPEQFGRIQGLRGLQPREVFAPVITDAEAGELLDLPERCYKVTLKLENHGQLADLVNAFARDITDEETTTRTEPNVPLGPGHSRSVQITVPIREFVQRRTRVGLSLTDSLGAWEFLRGCAAERSSKPLIVCMDRSYYTSETQGGLIHDINLPEMALQHSRIRINAPFLATDTVRDVQQASARVSLPLTDLAPGSHEIEAELESAEGSLIARESCVLVKRVPSRAGTEVKADRWNRCMLVNREPFFPIGHFHGPPGKMVKDMGMNTVIPWQGASPGQFKELLDRAHQYGLSVFLPPELAFAGFMSCADPRFPAKIRSGIENTLPELLELAAGHPALLAWYTVDEPAGDAIRRVIGELRDALMTGDGYHPSAPLFCRGFPVDERWVETMDMGLVDIYWQPTRRSSMAETLEWLAQGQGTTRRWNMPYWIAIVSEFTSNSYRGMLPCEQRANTYLALVHDATAVFYFVWPIRHTDVYAMFRALAGEITELAPSLLQRPPRQTVHIEGGDEDTVKVRLKKRPAGGHILLAVTTVDAPVDVTVKIPGLKEGGAVQRLFAANTYRVRNETFGDRLEGYGTRAYLIGEQDVQLEEPVAITLTLTMEQEEPGEEETRSLIPNHSFETDAGWAGVSLDGPISFDSSRSQDGARSLRLTRTQDAKTLFAATDTFTLKPHTHYRFGAWVRGEFRSGPAMWGGASLSVYSLTDRKSKLYLQTHTRNLDDWYRRTGTFTTGAETETVQCYLYADKGKYVGTAWIDNVFLVEESVAQSKNLAANSSFEYAVLPDYPVRWTSLFVLGGPERLTGGKEPALTMDEQVAYEGAHGLRLRGFHQFFSSPSRYDRGSSADPDKTYVLSVYAKAGRDGVECWLRINGDGANEWSKFKVDTEWKRYHAVGKPHPKAGTAQMSFRTEGAINTPWEDAPTVWIDAVQYEEGTTPTEYTRDTYRPDMERTR